MLPSILEHCAGTLTIAHRGASGLFPENTMSAFRGAVNCNADMIELDVQLTKDGVPVIFHDTKLDKHSTGDGLVAAHTLKELQTFDAGSWFNGSFFGERIPTLEQVLQFAQATIPLNIEIKTEAVCDDVKSGVEAKCLQLVEKYEMQQQVLFSSFDSRAIRHLKTFNPDIPVGILYSRMLADGRDDLALIEELKADSFHCSYRQLTQERFDNLQQHHVPVLVYTVDQPARMNTLIEMGINGIFTNKPDVLKNIITQKKSRSA